MRKRVIFRKKANLFEFGSLVKEFDRKLSLTRRAGKLLDSFDIRRPGKVEHSYQACFVNEFLGWLPAMKISMLIMNCEMIR